MRAVIFGCFLFGIVSASPAVNDQFEAADGGYIFEGDMILPKQKIERAIAGQDIEAGNAYGVSTYWKAKWPKNEVPYVIHPSAKNKVLGVVKLKGPTEKAIRNAMDEWAKKTCIKFVPRTTQQDYVEFIDAGYGKCYSHIGRTGGKQKISLGFGCFTQGIAMHEIGHALGLYHEQSRPDRDDFVEIVWSNIQKGKEGNFRKYSRGHIDSLGSPYDYNSLMHYSWNEFATFPYLKTTIRAKKAGAKFGQRSYISTEDAKQINSLYKCPKLVY